MKFKYQQIVSVCVCVCVSSFYLWCFLPACLSSFPSSLCCRSLVCARARVSCRVAVLAFHLAHNFTFALPAIAISVSWNLPLVAHTDKSERATKRERESKRGREGVQRKTAAISPPTFSFPRLGASHESIIHHHRLSKSRPWPSCLPTFLLLLLHSSPPLRGCPHCAPPPAWQRDFIVMIFAACNGALEGLWPASQNSRNNKRVQFSFPCAFSARNPRLMIPTKSRDFSDYSGVSLTANKLRSH